MRNIEWLSEADEIGLHRGSPEDRSRTAQKTQKVLFALAALFRLNSQKIQRRYS